MTKEQTFKFYQKTAKGEKLVTKKEHQLNDGEKDFLLGTLLCAWENNPYENQEKFIRMFLEALQKPIKDKEAQVLQQYMDWLDVNKN